MGYLPIEEKHHAALLSLVAPLAGGRLLDPFAGEGIFLEKAAQHWKMTPYAAELDGDRAQACIERFGPQQAVQCDVEKLQASNQVFDVGFYNPPYDVDKMASGSKRVEYRYLRHAWKWVRPGGLVLWVIYQQHLTDEAITFLSKHSQRVDVWGLPGKHQGEYHQIVVAAIVGRSSDPETLSASIHAQKADPQLLTVQAEPAYKLPKPMTPNRFMFTAERIDAAHGLALLENQGAWTSAGFQALLNASQATPDIEPVVAPRPGHMAFVLAGKAANGAVLPSQEYNRVAIRSRIFPVEEERIEETAGENEKRIVRLKPKTVLTLLSEQGQKVQMEGDDALLDFIQTNREALVKYLNQRFQPLYQFDYNGLGQRLSEIRLNGTYELFAAQKHVIGAITKGFEHRDGIMLIGAMGTGKTAIGSGVTSVLGGTVLIVCPPHLVQKWRRELQSVDRGATIRHLKRHEDVKKFMSLPGRLKVGIIKRDMTKLGSGWQAAVVWRVRSTALWRPDQRPLEGYEPHQRIVKTLQPHCPTCGSVAMKDEDTIASQSWLADGKRTCSVCQHPLWMMDRDKGSRPKQGDKYPRKAPRYRLDEYIKRFYKDQVDLLVWDEVHEAQHSDTGNGEAFGRLANSAHKILALTGTPFNGKASSLFNVEYHLNPRVRQQYPWGGAPRLHPKQPGSRFWQTVKDDHSRQKGQSESRWVADMGVREKVIYDRPVRDADTGAVTGTSTYERPYDEAPGISPLLVAEMLDHCIYFSLTDLGKNLPEYEEIAMPVTPDFDIAYHYDRINDDLLDRLKALRKDGDNTFAGAYLQWAMGWVNAPYRPYTVIHRQKAGGGKRPVTVKSIPSFGEDRVFAKENALIDLVVKELREGRPCVVYVRQSNKRDIQPRLEYFLQRIAGAKPFVLRQKVAAERRELVIQKQVDSGTDGIISNPELVKTGLDLLNFPTIIFYEITFNLSTLMQAAARSYRLNQTHDKCKVVYMYYEGTMEEQAVQLMSRKQRAAKLLTGETGLTGLEALTEGDGGFEAALLDAIGKDERLVDPAQMFAKGSEIDTLDAGYWQVEETVAPTVVQLPEPEVMTAEAEKPMIRFRKEVVSADLEDGTLVQLSMF